MADIKTRESLRSIKVLDNTRRALRKTGSETQKIKSRVSEMVDASYESESEYAGNKMEEISRRAEQKAVSKTIEESQKSFDRVKKIYRNIRSSHSKQVPSKTRKGIKTAERTVRDTEKAAKAAKKTVEKTAKASKRAAEASKKAAQATVKAAKAAAQAIAKAVKAIVAGIKALVSAIAAGGWVAVLIIAIICIVALVVAALFGWLIPKDNDSSFYAAVIELKTDYAERIEEIKSASEYDEIRVTGDSPDYKGCISLFAVKENLDPDDPKDLVSLNEQSKDRLKKLFWELHSIIYQISVEKTERTIQYEDKDGTVCFKTEEVIVTVLTITTDTVERDTYTEKYRLTNQQSELLTELLSPDFDDLWQGIVG
jgi:hypothetical protein